MKTIATYLKGTSSLSTGASGARARPARFPRLTANACGVTGKSRMATGVAAGELCSSRTGSITHRERRDEPPTAYTSPFSLVGLERALGGDGWDRHDRVKLSGRSSGMAFRVERTE